MALYAPTFADIKNIVYDKLRLDSTDDVTRVGNAINNTLNRIAIDTRYIKGSANTAALTAGASSFTLDTSIIEIDYLTCAYGGQTLILGEVTFDRLLALRQGGIVAGPPVAYSLRATTVELWPTAAGGDVITQYGASFPQALTGTDPVPFPEPYGSNMLAYGAASELSEFTKDILLAQTFASKYGEWVNEFNGFIQSRQGILPKQFIVEDGAHGYLPHDRSSDWDLIGPRPYYG